MEVKDILKMLTKENVISIMGDLYGATYKHNPDGSIAFESICHNSTSQKLYYYHEPRDEEDIGRNFYCYVCKSTHNHIELKLNKYYTEEEKEKLIEQMKTDNKYDYV